MKNLTKVLCEDEAGIVQVPRSQVQEVLKKLALRIAKGRLSGRRYDKMLRREWTLYVDQKTDQLKKKKKK